MKTNTLFHMVFLSCLLFVGQTAVAQKPHPMIKPAKDFEVEVEDDEVFVYDSEVAAFCMFNLNGEKEIKIKTKNNVKWVDIRPKSLGIKPSFKDYEISFTLVEPCNISVELNYESNRPLYIFANPPEKDKPSINKKDPYYFQAGELYNIGIIELKTGDEVYIEQGAIVRGGFKAENADNIKFGGRGIIDGTPRGTDSTGHKMIHLIDCKNVDIKDIVILNSHRWTVEPQNCDNVTIDNMKQVNWDFGSDGIDIVSSQNVTIKNCFLRNNDDCIAIKTWGGESKYPEEHVEGRNVENIEVSNCVFWNMSWGNAIEIGFELRAQKVSDITFRDCDIIHVDRGAAMSIHNGDYATVENVTFENIRIEDARHKLIDLAVFLSQYSIDRPPKIEHEHRYMHGAWDGVLSFTELEKERFSKNRGLIRDITFKNIQIVDGSVPFSVIYGFDEKNRVRDVTIKDFTIYGNEVKNPQDGKFTIEHAEKVKFK